MKIINNLIPKNFTRGRQGLDMPLFFVLHTYGGKGTSLKNWFSNNSAGVSAHTAIWKDGTVEILVPWSDTAHHAGNWWVNVRSIGIETQDDGNYMDAVRTVQMYDALSDYIAYTAFTLGHKILNESNIKKHNDYVAKACPGGLDADRVRRESNTKLQKMINPVDDLYRVYLGDVQVGAYTAETNAFSIWTENMAQSVTHKGNNITFNFQEMAKPLQAQLIQVSQELENEKKENEKNKIQNSELTAALEISVELQKKSTEQLNIEIQEKEKIQELNLSLALEIKKLTEKTENKPFNIFEFIYNIFFKK